MAIIKFNIYIYNIYMSLSRREPTNREIKASLRNEIEYLEQLLGKYEAILRIDLNLADNLSEEKKKSLTGLDVRMLTKTKLTRDALIDTFPEPAKQTLKKMNIPDRIIELNRRILITKRQIEERGESIKEKNTIRGNIIRTLGLSKKSRKGGRKSKRRSRKNKRKTRRKGGVLTSSASTAVADMTYKRDKSKKDDNSKAVKDSKVKDSKKKGESGFSFKLTKKMAPNFKKKKIYGGEDENLFISDKLNIDPNKKYKTIGIAHHTELAGINLVRDMGNDLFNMFGQKGFDTGLYNRARNDGIRVLINKLKSNQVLKSPKFDIELKDQQGIQVHITALVMEEVSDKEEKEKKD